MFRNRERELAALEARSASKGSELVVVYGRRRVGKSELLRHFVRDKPHIFLLGDLRSERDQLADATRHLHEFNQDPLLAAQPLPSWTVLLDYVARLARTSRLVVVLDEFQYYCESTPALPSILQKTWDEEASRSQLYLVLCGSYVSFMERATLAYESPLYGRRTGQLHVQPLDYRDAASFLPGQTPQEQIVAYAVAGGMPGYLTLLGREREVLEGVRTQILDPAAVLFSEARFLLMEELREPRVYFSLLRAIAAGKTRLNDIAQEAGLPSRTVSKYLDILQSLRLVERRLPATVRHPERSRQGIYRLADNYLAFWFRFVLPHQSYLEEGRADWVLQERVLPNLPAYVGPRFEEVCRQFLLRHRGTDLVPLEFDRIGGWWSGDQEIDVVAMSGPEIALVGECKWTNEWLKIGDLNELRRKAALAGAGPGTRYALFSRSGFDPNLKTLAGAEGVLLYGLDDLMGGGATGGDPALTAAGARDGPAPGG